jgi:hypothetical protein
MAEDVADDRAGLDRIPEASLSRMRTASILPQPERRAARGALQRAPPKIIGGGFCAKGLCSHNKCWQRSSPAAAAGTTHTGSRPSRNRIGVRLRPRRTKASSVSSRIAVVRPRLGQFPTADDGTKVAIGGHADHRTASALARERVRLRAEVRIKYVDFRAHPTPQRPPAILHIASISPARTICAQPWYQTGLRDAVKR